MTYPQLTKNLLEVIRCLLEQLGQDSGELSSQELVEMALAGQAFDDLAQEPDLYSFRDGEAIVVG
jgi:hypothetical protein